MKEKESCPYQDLAADLSPSLSRSIKGLEDPWRLAEGCVPISGRKSSEQMGVFSRHGNGEAANEELL